MVSKGKLASIVLTKSSFSLVNKIWIVFFLGLLRILGDLKFWRNLSERRSITRLFECGAMWGVLTISRSLSELVLCHLSMMEANWQISIGRGWVGTHSLSNGLNRSLLSFLFESQLLVWLPDFVGNIDLSALLDHVNIWFFISTLDHLPGEVWEAVLLLLRFHLGQFSPSVWWKSVIHGLPFYRTFCGLFSYLEISLWFTIVSLVKVRVSIFDFLLYLNHGWAPVGL